MSAKLILSALAMSLVNTVFAASWPDSFGRAERDLSAHDTPTRLAAARRLRSLGGAAAPLVLKALDDSDAGVQLAAADAAVHLHVVDAAARVLSWFNAPDLQLRMAACEVAAAVPDARVVASLVRTLGDQDAGVREVAALALGRQASAEVVAPLIGRLDDSAAPVRVAIANALARVGDARGIVPLIGKVEDSSREMRRAVARSLGALGDPKASGALLLDLRDQDQEVRQDAVVALGRLRAADATDGIAPLVRDRSPELRAAAAEALGRIATPKALAVLAEALGRDEDSAGELARTPVRDALVLAGTTSVAWVAQRLDQPPSSAAAGAAWVLGALHAREEAPHIVAAMRRGTLAPAAALHALQGAGTAEDLPVMLEWIADPRADVRREALAAAATLLDPKHPDGRALDPLEAAMASPEASPDDRRQMVLLMGRTGAVRAAPLLSDLTKASDLDLQVAAVDALGDLGSVGADESLLAALGSTEPRLRFHAAQALAIAGGARARDAMLTMLDGEEDADRASVLTALSGVVSRLPTEETVAKLSSALRLSAGPERDAFIEAIGRARLASATRVLADIAQSPEPLDRTTAGVLCAAHPGESVAIATARRLARDADAATRAQAAWTLGTIGEANDLGLLGTLAADSEIDVSADAVAAMGRIAARGRRPDVASQELCGRLTDKRPYVRANALAGLAAAHAWCQDGSAERSVLAGDADEYARAAAALAVRARGAPEDVRALERCAYADPSEDVSKACGKTANDTPTASAVRVYVLAEGSPTPRPSTPYAMLLADGMLHLGMTDRRGAVFDPAMPEGFVTLAPSWPPGP
jgi:HEAT repeat protein